MVRFRIRAAGDHLADRMPVRGGAAPEAVDPVTVPKASGTDLQKAVTHIQLRSAPPMPADPYRSTNRIDKVLLPANSIREKPGFPACGRM